jgi:hypothetical protein
MKLEEVEKKLREVCEKHQLSYEELNNEFELLDFFYSKRVGDNFLRNIRRRFVEVMYNYITYLHNFIAPNPQSIIIMQEAEFFSDAEKDEMDSIMKKIMLINRMSMKLELKPDEKQDAEFIKKNLEEWKTLKPKIQKITDKLIESWQKTL